MDERVNDINILINDIIQFKLADGTINDVEANVLRDMRIRIQNNTELLDAIINFNKSFLALNANWNSNVSSTLSVSSTLNANSLARMLLALL